MSTFLLHSQFFYLSHTELHWGTGVTHSPQLLSFCLLQPGFSVGNTSPSGKSNVPVSCPPLAAVQISALLWLSIACKGSSALVPRVPLSFLPSFFSGLGVHTTVPHSVFHPPLLPECWFCLFLNTLLQRYHHYLSLKAVSGPAAPSCQSIVTNTSSFCLFIFFYFPFLSPLSFYFPIFCLCFLSLLSSLLFSQCFLFLSCPPHPHPITSCSDKRTIFLLKQKYEIILNLFYEARTIEISKFNFSFVRFYSKPKKVHFLCLMPFFHQSSGKSPQFLCFFSPVFN